MGGDPLKGEQAPHGRQAADLTEQGKENALKKLTQGLEELGVMLLAAFAVLVMVPTIIVGIAGHNAGLLVSILLLLVVNPAFFAFLGMYAGKKDFAAAVKGMVLAGGTFLFGAGLALKMTSDFALRYMAVYLAIGFIAMGLTALSRKKKK